MITTDHRNAEMISVIIFPANRLEECSGDMYWSRGVHAASSCRPPRSVGKDKVIGHPLEAQMVALVPRDRGWIKQPTEDSLSK